MNDQLTRIDQNVTKLVAALVPSTGGAIRHDVKRGLDAMFKALREDRLIEAIKEYRSLTGCPLKESKNAVIGLRDALHVAGRAAIEI